MIHPSTKLLFISEQIGHGVVATQLIPAGTIVWTMDQLDRIIDPSEFLGKEDLYEELLDTYCYKNHEGKYVLCWDYSKYMNHSFRPNTISTAYYFDIAIRDIQKGEEVTCDYGYLNVEEPFYPLEEGTERKVVYPDDLVNFHHIWDQQLLETFPRALKVKQPLKPLMAPEIWDEILRICEGQSELKSTLNLLWKENIRFS